MAAKKHYRVAVGIVRKGDQVLLVRQQGPTDPEPTWALPGGVVEDGELFHEGLAREIREETGLEVSQIKQLAYLVELDNQDEGYQTLAMVFEFAELTGRVGGNDPDRLIQAIEFVALDEALRRLERLPWRHMREPAVAYLSASDVAPRLWQYRQYDGGVELLEAIGR